MSEEQKDKTGAVDDFFAPAEPIPEDEGSGKFPMVFTPGRPVTIIEPQVPRAKSSVPYVTIGLALLAVASTVTIALLLRGQSAPEDEPPEQEAVARAADAEPGSGSELEAGDPEAPKPEGASPAVETEAPQPAPARAVAKKKSEPAQSHKKSAHERARLQHQRGNGYLRRNRLVAAVASYERALELDPTFIEANGPLAVAYARLGKGKKARAAFTVYFEGTPEKDRARLKRKLFEKFGKKGAAGPLGSGPRESPSKAP